MTSKGGSIHSYLSFISYIGTKFSGTQRQIARRNLEEIATFDTRMTVQQALDHSLFYIIPKPLYTSGKKIFSINDNQTKDENQVELLNDQSAIESKDDLEKSTLDQAKGKMANNKRQYTFDDTDLYGYKTYVTSRTDAGVCSTMNCFLFDLRHPFEKYYKPDHLTLMMNRYLLKNKLDLIVNKTIIFNKSVNYEIVKEKQYCYRIAILKPNILEKNFITKFNFLNHDLNNTKESSQILNKSNVNKTRDEDMISYALYSYLPINELNRVLVLNSKYLINEDNKFVEKRINIDNIKKAIKLFYGTHDYTTFSTYNNRSNSIKTRTPIKTISRFELIERNVYNDSLFDSKYQNFYWYDVYVKADGFLYNQIRRMLGTLIAYGFGLITLDDIQYMLDNPNHRNFHCRCIITPPTGLYLNQVDFNSEIEEHILNEEFMFEEEKFS